MHSFRYKYFGLSKTKIVFTTRHEPEHSRSKNVPSVITPLVRVRLEKKARASKACGQRHTVGIDGSAHGAARPHTDNVTDPVRGQQQRIQDGARCLPSMRHLELWNTSGSSRARWCRLRAGYRASQKGEDYRY